jgi:hypothetical protein
MEQSRRQPIRVVIIVAVGASDVMGEPGGIPRIFEASGQMDAIARAVEGHTVAVGRRAAIAMGGRPPGGRVIVLSGAEPLWRYSHHQRCNVECRPEGLWEGVAVARSVDDAFAQCTDDALYVLGGRATVEAFLPYASRVVRYVLRTAPVDPSPPPDAIYLPACTRPTGFMEVSHATSTREGFSYAVETRGLDPECIAPAPNPTPVRAIAVPRLPVVPYRQLTSPLCSPSWRTDVKTVAAIDAVFARLASSGARHPSASLMCDLFRSHTGVDLSALNDDEEDDDDDSAADDQEATEDTAESKGEGEEEKEDETVKAALAVSLRDLDCDPAEKEQALIQSFYEHVRMTRLDGSAHDPEPDTLARGHHRGDDGDDAMDWIYSDESGGDTDTDGCTTESDTDDSGDGAQSEHECESGTMEYDGVDNADDDTVTVDVVYDGGLDYEDDADDDATETERDGTTWMEPAGWMIARLSQDWPLLAWEIVGRLCPVDVRALAVASPRVPRIVASIVDALHQAGRWSWDPLPDDHADDDADVLRLEVKGLFGAHARGASTHLDPATARVARAWLAMVVMGARRHPRMPLAARLGPFARSSASSYDRKYLAPLVWACALGCRRTAYECMRAALCEDILGDISLPAIALARGACRHASPLLFDLAVCIGEHNVRTDRTFHKRGPGDLSMPPFLARRIRTPASTSRSRRCVGAYLARESAFKMERGDARRRAPWRTADRTERAAFLHQLVERVDDALCAFAGDRTRSASLADGEIAHEMHYLRESLVEIVSVGDAALRAALDEYEPCPPYKTHAAEIVGRNVGLVLRASPKWTPRSIKAVADAAMRFASLAHGRRLVAILCDAMRDARGLGDGTVPCGPHGASGGARAAASARATATEDRTSEEQEDGTEGGEDRRHRPVDLLHRLAAHEPLILHHEILPRLERESTPALLALSATNRWLMGLTVAWVRGRSRRAVEGLERATPNEVKSAAAGVPRGIYRYDDNDGDGDGIDDVGRTYEMLNLALGWMPWIGEMVERVERATLLCCPATDQHPYDAFAVGVALSNLFGEPPNLQSTIATALIKSVLAGSHHDVLQCLDCVQRLETARRTCIDWMKGGTAHGAHNFLHTVRLMAWIKDNVFPSAPVERTLASQWVHDKTAQVWNPCVQAAYAAGRLRSPALLAVAARMARASRSAVPALCHTHQGWVDLDIEAGGGKPALMDTAHACAYAAVRGVHDGFECGPFCQRTTDTAAFANALARLLADTQRETTPMGKIEGPRRDPPATLRRKAAALLMTARSPAPDMDALNRLAIALLLNEATASP